MKPTRPWPLAVIVICCALAAWLVVRATFTSLPPLPWTSALTLLLLAAAEGLTGRNVRARILGRGAAKPMPPIAIARMAVLARASSAAAAVVAGLAAGFLAYVGGSLDKTVPRDDAYSAGATLVAAVILGGAALYLEHCCRTPEPPEEDEEGGQRPGNQSGVR
jgi:Protein of unknown function (DUF3180)